MQKISKESKGIGNNRIVQWNGDRVNSITIKMDARLKDMVTKLETTLETGKIYFGI